MEVMLKKSGSIEVVKNYIPIANGNVILQVEDQNALKVKVVSEKEVELLD